MLLPFLSLISLFPLLPALFVITPETCGGDRVVQHAAALFGPKPSTSGVRDALIFAPLPQIATPASADHSAVMRQSPPRFSRSIHPPPRGQPSALAATQRRCASLLDAIFRLFLPARAALPPKPATPLTRGLRARDARAKSRYDYSAGGGASFDLDGMMDVHALFDACAPLSSAEARGASRGRVVIVKRGVCEFVIKVANLEEAGAIGVIVVNFASAGDTLANMRRNKTGEYSARAVSIPSVMISHKAWVGIAPCENETKVLFSAQGETAFAIDSGMKAINWALLRGIGLWVVCQFGVTVFRYKRRSSDSLHDDTQLPFDT